jgi:hypothetical protein
VVGFSIPNFKAWYAEHAAEDGAFEVDLPPVWPAAGSPPAGGSDRAEGDS